MKIDDVKIDDIKIYTEDFDDNSSYYIKIEDIKEVLRAEAKKEVRKVSQKVKAQIKQEIEEDIRQGKIIPNIINNITLKNGEEEKVEEIVEVKRPIHSYIVGVFFIGLVLFAIFYEIFIDVDSNSKVTTNIQENTVMLHPVQEEAEVADTSATNETIDESTNVIDSLFSFANRGEKEAFPKMNFKSEEIKGYLKEKVSNIFEGLKDKAVE